MQNNCESEHEKTAQITKITITFEQKVQLRPIETNNLELVFTTFLLGTRFVPIQEQAGGIQLKSIKGLADVVFISIGPSIEKFLAFL